jgi:hypothetical protein
MGQAKQQWIEAESRGYSLPDTGDKYVCASHFEDPYLQQYIEEHSNPRMCDYCGIEAKVIDLRYFMEYVGGKITEHYGSPDNEDLWLASSFYDDENEEIPGYQRVGPFISPSHADYYESITELLSDLWLTTDNSQLDKDIEGCFLRDEWIQRDPAAMTKGQELSFMWKRFERMVKHEQRFTFLQRPEFLGENPSSDNGLDDILTEIGRQISEHGLCKEIDTDSVIYRCRFIAENEVVDSFDKITSAPNDKAKQSRMSPAGISMFYGAFDEETAIVESKEETKDRYIIGKFKTKKRLHVLDITHIPQASFWMPSDWEGLAFLHSFRHQITKRIEHDDRIHIDYIPSQVFTEYLRYIFRNSKGERIDGVIYPSSLFPSGKNIVLFYNQRTSTDILELDSSYIIPHTVY